MAINMSEDEYMAQLGGDVPKTPEALLINIDAAKSTLKQEKNEYRIAVKNLISVEKKYQSAKLGAESRASRKRKARLVEAEERLKSAVQSVRTAEKRTLGVLSAAQKENDMLCELYQSYGKARQARKQNNAFDKFYLNEERNIKRIGEEVAGIIAEFLGASEQPKQQKKSDPTPERQQKPPSQPPRQDMPPRTPANEPPRYERREGSYYDRPYDRHDGPYYDRYYQDRPHHDRYYPERYDRPPFYPDTRVDPFIYRQNVTISPVSVDLSPLIEEAVKETMAKFVATIEQRVDAYIEALGAKMPAVENKEAETEAPSAEPTVGANTEAAVEVAPSSVVAPMTETSPESTGTAEKAPVSESTPVVAASTEPVIPNEKSGDVQEPSAVKTTELAAATAPAVSAAPVEDVKSDSDSSALQTVAKEEENALKKLTALIESIKAIVTDADALSAVCAEIAAKQNEALALQKTISESHRAMLREMQGIQVKQKVISGDQEQLVEAQESTVTRQAEILEKQKLIEEALGTNAEKLDTIAKISENTESTIKETSTLQKANATQSAKMLEAQLELVSKQQEIAQRQKDAAAAQKKLEKKVMADR